MQMAVEEPNPPVFSYKFQGMFNSSVFSELTEHAVEKEAEMIDVHQNLTVLSRLVFALMV